MTDGDNPYADAFKHPDKLQINETEQLNEGTKEAISSFALALALLIPGVVSAKTIHAAQ